MRNKNQPVGPSHLLENSVVEENCAEDCLTDHVRSVEENVSLKQDGKTLVSLLKISNRFADDDLTQEGDRQWFRNNPDRNYRVRGITQLEKLASNYDGVPTILVVQMLPGFRYRVGLNLQAVDPGEAALEEFARCTWVDLYTKSEPTLHRTTIADLREAWASLRLRGEM